MSGNVHTVEAEWDQEVVEEVPPTVALLGLTAKCREGDNLLIIFDATFDHGSDKRVLAELDRRAKSAKLVGRRDRVGASFAFQTPKEVPVSVVEENDWDVPPYAEKSLGGEDNETEVFAWTKRLKAGATDKDVKAATSIRLVTYNDADGRVMDLFKKLVVETMAYALNPTGREPPFPMGFVAAEYDSDMRQAAERECLPVNLDVWYDGVHDGWVCAVNLTTNSVPTNVAAQFAAISKFKFALKSGAKPDRRNKKTRAKTCREEHKANLNRNRTAYRANLDATLAASARGK